MRQLFIKKVLSSDALTVRQNSRIYSLLYFEHIIPFKALIFCHVLSRTCGEIIENKA